MPGFRPLEDQMIKKSETMNRVSNTDDMASTATDSVFEARMQAEPKLPSIPAELLCPQCMELYDQPLFLPCSHTFCKSCTTSLMENSEKVLQQRKRFICPTCRNIIKYGAEGVECLPRNVNLEQAVTRYKLESKARYPLCAKHKQFNMELLMWCETCGCTLCPLCALEDNHKDHKIAPLKVLQKFKEVRKRLCQTTKALTNKIETIGGSILQSQNVVSSIEMKGEDLKKKVDQECDEMARQVEIRRENMYKDIEKAMHKKQWKRQQEIKSLRAEYNQAKDLLGKISNVLETDGPTDFLKELEESGLAQKVEQLTKLSS